MIKTGVVAASIAALLIGCDGDPSGSSEGEVEGGADFDEIEADLAAINLAGAPETVLDLALRRTLRRLEFTGRVESTLERRLGRPIDRALADLGRLIWFDKAGGLHDDNTCGGCHAPSDGFGDTQSIAIGVQNNNLVGPNRAGPRNQRRTPTVINNAFYPALMWNSRFSSLSGDPFDNSAGFEFPLPEGTSEFGPSDPISTHLLIAQAHIPPTELVEVAGFTGTAGPSGRSSISSTTGSARRYRRPTRAGSATSRSGRRSSPA